jgi:hypothetical protein
MIKPMLIDSSPISPINHGAIAPPTIDMMRKDDALFVSFPKFLIDMEKIVGNMIDSKK